MINLVVDNTRSSSPFLVFVAARGMPSHAARSIIETLRDLSIDLARRGHDQVEIHAEMTKSAEFMIRELFSNFFSAGELADLVRLMGQEIDRLLDLALPLRAVPQPTEKPMPVAEPGDDGIIDVEFEEVFDLRDDDTSAVLFARAA